MTDKKMPPQLLTWMGLGDMALGVVLIALGGLVMNERAITIAGVAVLLAGVVMLWLGRRGAAAKDRGL